MASIVKKKREFLRKENKKYPLHLVRVPHEHLEKKVGTLPIEAWRSRDFLVQIYDVGEGLERMSVSRTMVNEVGNWVDGITWDELNRLKIECGRGDYEAFEFFPKTDHIVNVAHLRHLWIKRDWSFPFVWGPHTETVKVAK
jgi:hypothetical protein